MNQNPDGKPLFESLDMDPDHFRKLGYEVIDACHIVPFCQSHDDTITNGISLCPILHRAFDRGLISLDSEYRVLVKSFSEEANLYSIKKFEGALIHLPNLHEYFPAQENLAAHRLRHKFI